MLSGERKEKAECYTMTDIEQRSTNMKETSLVFANSMEQSGAHNAEKIINKGPILGMRHVQIVLLFTMLAFGYAMRVNLSVGIVAMTDNTTSLNPMVPTYNWTNKSIVLSSFYWGYICLQIFAGQLGKLYGTKWLAFIAMGINSTACIIIPFMAEAAGSYGVMGCRVVQGLSQGFFFPSVHNILGQWAPLEERSTLGTIAFAGPSFGTIVSLIVSGALSSSWIGWPSAFYLFGGLGYVWMLAWIILSANTPATHSQISLAEREYIEKSLSVKANEKVFPTPWKDIFTSLPVWAFIVAMFGQNWGYSTLLTEIPNYLNKIMNFDMHSNSILSAAPYLASFILSFVFGALSDFLINRNFISLENARKLFNSIGLIVPAIALVVLGYLPENQSVLSVMMLIIAVGVNAACFTGFQINPVDLSPRFSGVLMGIGNGSSNIFSIIAPLVVQFVVGSNEEEKALWRTIFIIAACVYVVSAIFFIIFASGKVQPWNDEEKEENSCFPSIFARITCLCTKL
ncbi:putative inorganic phosphate cotransporter isoform X1 [Diorhabda carinulata]|uniref:putative inorganic phosphate cotransporter isoform X1 n=2 Tax=Diorhabda carinulata TaxID=1163345 RepID=UPI0025A09FD6|nr:putative inorganic phosphate cotransporter isoform X1 [Diorhabda carinulata]